MSRLRTKFYRCRTLGRQTAITNLYVVVIALIGVTSSYADTKKNYCPEQEFVDVCLTAMTGISELEDWAKQNGRQWLPESRPLGQRTALIGFPVPGWLSVYETPITDTRILRCTLTINIFVNAGGKAQCDPTLPLVANAVPENAFTSKNISKFGQTVFFWKYEQKDWRVSASVTVTPDGDFAYWTATKIKVAPRPSR